MRLLVLLCLLAVTLAAVRLVLSLLTRRAKAEYDAESLAAAQISALTTNQARQRAIQLLGAGTVLRPFESPVDPESLPPGLPTLLRDFFARFRAVEAAPRMGDVLASVQRSAIRPSQLREGFVKIGNGMEATDVEYELAFTPNSEQVVELYAGEPPDSAMGTHPTIYHWLLAIAREVEDEEDRNPIRA